MATATDPVIPVVPADVRHLQDLRHLQVLSSDSQWSAGALSSRICGVTHDTPDAGFSGKSCLPPDIHIVRSDGSVELALCEELDPETEDTLREHYLAEAEPIPRQESRTDFLREIDPPRLYNRWTQEDRRARRSDRALRRSQGRQFRRRRLEHRVGRMEVWFYGLGSLPTPARRHYQSCWEQLKEDLEQARRNRRGSHPQWVNELLQRLWPIRNPLLQQPTTAFNTKQYQADQSPTVPKNRRKHSKKHSRQNKKHTSAKVHVHRRPAFG